MVFWFITFNYVEVLATLAISLVVIVVGWIIFQRLWLYNEELQVPTSYYKNEYKFESQAGFLTKMRVLIADILNHDYWIKHVGFDGALIRLLLSTVHAQDCSVATDVLGLLLLWLADLLLGGENHESGVCREYVLQRHGDRVLCHGHDLHHFGVHAHVS